jgi:hypothetical protein
MRLRSRGRLAVVASFLVVGAAAAGVGYASIPSGGTIHGCYLKYVGLLRVIDTAAGGACTSAEMKLDWNQSGPQGPPGPPGPPGVQGPPGQDGAGPAYVASADGPSPQFAGSSTQILTLTVPAGDYILAGKLVATNEATGNVGTTFVTCSITDGSGAVDTSSAQVESGPSSGAPNGRETLSLLAAVQPAAPTTYDIECNAEGNLTSASDARLVATAVRSVN